MAGKLCDSLQRDILLKPLCGLQSHIYVLYRVGAGGGDGDVYALVFLRCVCGVGRGLDGGGGGEWWIDESREWSP